MIEPLPQSLQIYIDFMAKADRPVGSTEVLETTPGYNGFRHLKDRGLIKNIVRGYKPGEPFTGPKPVKYVLTKKGRQYVSSENMD